MSKILIESIQVNNFRDFDNRTFRFRTHNTISGDNTLGKSSLGEAIVYGLYGITIQGSDRTDSLIKNGTDKMSVSISFIAPDNKRYVVARTKTTKSSAVRLNGKPSNQDKINDILTVEDKVFLAAFNNNYLQAESLLSPITARKFFLNLVPHPAHGEVLNALDEDSRKIIINNDNEDNENGCEPKQINQKLTQLKEFETMLYGNKTELTRQISSLGEAMGDENYTQADIDNYAKEILELKDQKASIVIEPTPVKQKIDVASLENQLAQQRANYKLLNEQIVKSMPREPETGKTCDSCNQPYSDSAIASIKNEWSKKIEIINASNSKITERLREIAANGTILSQELEAAKNQIENIDKTHKESYAKWEASSKENRDKIKEIDEQIDMLYAKILAVKVHLSSIKRKQEMMEQLSEVTKSIETAKEQQKDLLLLKDAYNKYFIKQSELVASKINEKLKSAQIKLFDTNKSNGNIKAVFKLLYNNTPVPLLSTSEKIRLGMELSNTVINLTGVKMPVFFDCCESITNFSCDISGVQCFYAHVKEGSELSIQSMQDLPQPINVGEVKTLTETSNSSQNQNSLFDVTAEIA